MVDDLGPYITRLIGQPWERRGLHCWALVEKIQKERFDRAAPQGPAVAPGRDRRRELMAVDAEPLGWTESTEPQHGAIVRMYRVGGNPADLEHAGVYLAVDGGIVLHTDDPHGVVADTLLELRTRGWVPRWFVPLNG